MINFYSFKNKSYLVSLILILLTIIVIFFKGLNLGIDFKGGLNFEVKTNLTTSQLNQYIDFVDTEREVLIKREVGSDVYSIRIESGENNPVFIEEIKNIISQNPDIQILLSEYIEPTFSEELIKNSIYALASSLLVIAIYVWIRFDWQFAASGIFALLHDVFVCLLYTSPSPRDA